MDWKSKFNALEDNFLSWISFSATPDSYRDKRLKRICLSKFNSIDVNL
jgi:hypothetical protein